MNKYTEKSFKIPELAGISAKNIEEHLKLYSGYVKNTNLILEKIEELASDSDPSTSSGQENAYVLGELQRRFSFEWNGMRNHEYYFESFEGGSTPLTTSGALYKTIEKEFGSFENWLARFKAIAKTRGIGWAILYYDMQEKKLVNTWIDEQHLGHLNSCQYIAGIDMWEHSYVADYQPSGKGKYIDDYFDKNLNWGKAEENFGKARS